MSYIVKDKSISRWKQMQGYAFEFHHHMAEFRWFFRKPKNSKKKTLRTKRIGR